MKKTKLILSTFVVFALSLSGCNLIKETSSISSNEESSSKETTSQNINSSNSNESHTSSDSQPSTSDSSADSQEISPSDNTSSSIHTHVWGDWSSVTPASCTEPGVEHRTCSVCGQEETRDVAAVGHAWEETWTIDVEATCEHMGSKSHHCANCNAKKDETPIDQKSHEPADPVIENEVPASCTKGGSYDEVVYCVNCHSELSRKYKTTSDLSHSYGEWSTVDPATCTEGGLERRTCSRCGQEETRETDALGHSWNNGVVTTQPTADSEGVRTYTCIRCSKTRTESIPALFVIANANATLENVAIANIQINFNEVTNNCMVSPKVKAYVDAMEAQEKTLDKPYHFSSLYGPDDYNKIAAASDKGDGVTYSAADTGGVDVCQMLRQSDYSSTAENYPIQLSWDNNGVSFESAKLKFWSTANQSDLREVDLASNATSARLSNLYRATKYRAQLVTNDGKASEGFEFVTGDYPRTITMGNIKNVRDIGGYMTSYGVRTTQGLIYRGYYIDDKSGGHGINYNDAAGIVQDEVMKIGYELDLQTSSETNGRTTSCLNGASYQCLTLVSYENFLKQSSYQNLPAVFSILANADQKHVYFHCWGGADRTGMLAFFINAICGVSYTDLIEDFEITTETNNKRCHMHNSSNAHFPRFLNAFINQWSDYDANKTINENCEKWLLDVAGVDSGDIEKIREIMIPGYHSGMEQHIPTYTAAGEWQTDDLAHWKTAQEDNNVKCLWARHTNNPCTVCNAENSSSGSGASSSNEVPVLVRNWDATTTSQTNSDGKQYFVLTDTSNKVMGVKIAITNYTVESDAADGTALGSDGKIGPVNNTDAKLTYRITAPKIGSYQMIMRGKCSSTATEKTLAERKFTVTLNGQPVDIKNSRIAVSATNGDFVAAPTLDLTGNEDVIQIACPDYRIVFDTSSYIVFAEI